MLGMGQNGRNDAVLTNNKKGGVCIRHGGKGETMGVLAVPAKTICKRFVRGLNFALE